MRGLGLLHGLGRHEKQRHRPGPHVGTGAGLVAAHQEISDLALFAQQPDQVVHVLFAVAVSDGHHVLGVAPGVLVPRQDTETLVEAAMKHLFDGTPNSCGSLFVHCDNRFMQDDVTYIFGHHMYGGAMFGNLKKYDSSSYYWSNPEFKLYTPWKTYVLRIYSVFYGTGNEQITFNFSSEASFNSVMAKYASRSQHQPQVSVSYGDKFVCLCTCAYQVTDGRYFVLCKVMN